MIVINILLGLLGAGIGSGIMVLVQMKVQRKWQLEDRSAEKNEAQAESMNALTEALKVLMIDRVRTLGRQYIADGYISLEDKETIHEMYDSYKSLGGNGHLSMLMSEVDNLDVR